MAMKPKVCIAVACKGQAQFLADAIGSLVAQTFTEWQAVIAAGDEESYGEALQLQRGEPRVLLVTDICDLGLADARNRALRLSDSPYCMALDADDMLAPTYLEKTMAVVGPATIATTNVQKFGDSTDVWDVESLVPEFAARIRWGDVIHGASVFSRDLWEGIGGWNVSMLALEDWELWNAMADEGARVAHVPERLFLYRRHSGAGSLNKFQPFCRAIIDLQRAPGSQQAIEMLQSMPSDIRARFAAQYRAFPEKTELRELDSLGMLSEPRAASVVAPLVGVAITCKGQACFLSEAIGSLVAQTYPHWLAVIACGDADSLEEAHRLAKQESRLQVLPELAINGLADSRNLALRSVPETPYCMALDADDMLAPTYLQRLVPLLDADRIAACNQQHFGARHDGWDCNLSEDEFTRVLPTTNLIPTSSVFPRALWTAVGEFDPLMICYEDWDLWLAMSQRGAKITHIADRLFLRRFYAGSMTDRHRPYYNAFLAIIKLRYVAQNDPEALAVLEDKHDTPNELIAQLERLCATFHMPGILARARDRLATARTA
jgi:glycosyltransferase involved in cell wall biosynthesis